MIRYRFELEDAEGADALEKLHGDILEAWNHQDENAYANAFVEDALVIGFDGSEMHGRSAIRQQLAQIFADHRVATYVRVVRGTQPLGEGVGLLQAVVGMVPPNGTEVMPDRHAVQVLVGRCDDGQWRAVSFQNTPAQLEGRSDAVDDLTKELNDALRR